MSTDTDPELDDDGDPEEPAENPFEVEEAHRLWLGAVLPTLSSIANQSGLCPRVQYACDRAAIAICERIERICHSDLPQG